MNTVNIHIEVQAFISYRSFLTQCLNETGVYLGPGVYLINTLGEDVLWTNWAYTINLQFVIFTCNNEMLGKLLHSLWYGIACKIWHLLAYFSAPRRLFNRLG